MTKVWTMVMLFAATGCAHKGQTQASPSLPVTEYRVQADQLDLHNPDPRHPEAVKALRSLATAVQSLPVDTHTQANHIDSQADAIVESPKTANHSGPTKRALQEALIAIEKVQVRSPRPGLAGSLDRARAQVNAIDPAVPFLQEKAVIDGAFAAVADALVLASISPQAATPALESREVVLRRYFWDQRGPEPNIPAVCGASGAESVIMKHKAGDVAFGVLTLGTYTPVHARVTCRTVNTIKL